MKKIGFILLGFLIAVILIATIGAFILKNKVSMTSGSEIVEAADTASFRPEIIPITPKGFLAIKDTITKPTIVNFWASWCIPCKREVPLLIKYCLANNVNLLFISGDRNNDLQKEKMKSVMGKFGMKSSYIISSSSLTDLVNKDAMTDFMKEIKSDYSNSGIPYLMVLDSNGEVMNELNGFNEEEAFNEFMQKKVFTVPH